MSPSVSRPTRFAARQRRTVALAAVAVLAVGMSACGSSSDTSTGTPSGETSQSALQFTAPLVGGGVFDGASLVGKPVAFWFWAPT